MQFTFFFLHKSGLWKLVFSTLLQRKKKYKLHLNLHLPVFGFTLILFWEILDHSLQADEFKLLIFFEAKPLLICAKYSKVKAKVFARKCANKTLKSVAKKKLLKCFSVFLH